jgi:hypothetical protein
VTRHRHVVRFFVVALFCAVALSSALLPVAGATDHATAQGEPCPGATFDPAPLDVDWEQTYADGADEDSLSDWTADRLAQVGPDGGCSLAVLDGNRTRLTAATINGTRGVVTGTVDLGANGSFELSDGRQASTVPVVRISNSGPDFASTIVVSTVNDSRTVSLPTERFFEFAVVRTNGTTTVSIWDVSSGFETRQQVRFENTTATGRLDLRLDGRAFLAEIATGFVRPDQSQTDPGDETGSEDGPSDDESDDAFEEQFPEQSQPDQRERASGQGASLGWGIVFFFLGAFEYYYARPLADFSEKIDAIGSTTPSGEVEAAAWKFRLTQIGGLLFCLLGVFIIVQSVL